MNVVINPRAFDQLKAEMIGRLDLAGHVIAESIRDLIDSPYPPASEPFTPPHMRTGRLYESYEVLVRPNEAAVYIGSELFYVEYLEDGTATMDPRPHIMAGFLLGFDLAVRVILIGA